MFKSLSLLALIALLPINTLAEIKGSPFIPEIDARFDQVEGIQSLKAVYDSALHGVNSGEDKPLGKILPENAVVVGVKMYVNSAFTDSGTGSGKLKCGSTDLIAYSDFTALSAGAILNANVASGSPGSSAMLEPPLTDRTGETALTGPCELTFLIRGDSGYVPLTGGKASFIIDYFVK